MQGCALRIPTLPRFEFFKKSGRSFLKQKDFSKTRRFFSDAHITYNWIDKPGTECALLGIIRDIAVMHKNGLASSPHERPFAPWVVYRKPNRKFDRAIIDFGSIYFPHDPAEAARSFAGILLPLLLHTKGREFARKAVQKYLAINPVSGLQAAANHFLA